VPKCCTQLSGNTDQSSNERWEEATVTVACGPATPSVPEPDRLPPRPLSQSRRPLLGRLAFSIHKLRHVLKKHRYRGEVMEASGLQANPRRWSAKPLFGRLVRVSGQVGKPAYTI
jgi:hypothetical protein